MTKQMAGKGIQNFYKHMAKNGYGLSISYPSFLKIHRI